jgi:class 3 adenylate cyclase
MVIARGRLLHAGNSFSTVDVLIEDALGRSIAHATGSAITTRLDPPPPTLASPWRPVEEPSYATPDPPQRPLGHGVDGNDGLPPFGRLIGAELVDVTSGSVRVALPTSEWFCLLRREVSPGVIALLGNLAIGRAVDELIDVDQRYVILYAAATALAPVAPDGRALTAVGRIRHRRGDILIAEAEIVDEDGQTVATVQGPCRVRERTHATHRPVERRLLTVLFTDLVGSTERAQQLGDSRWRDLLDQHNAVCRRQLELHKGREVKTTGDGVLATFDSPTAAIRCSRGIRDGLTELGLPVRIGIHTGECEIVGRDVAGLAVHVASRVQALAEPGEILISSTVRELIAASDFRVAPRGPNRLKGLEGTWNLVAISAD